MDSLSLQNLSPQSVHKAIESIKRSSTVYPPSFVDEVFRYGAPVGSKIEHLNNAARCMKVAKDHIVSTEEKGKAFPSGVVYIADQLSAGKGRFDRYWHAPTGGIWMALVLVNTLLPESTALYSLAAGVACCEAVRSHQIKAQVKWVNDVRIAGRKVAGILTETMQGPRFGEEYILIGIGLNVNNTEFPAELSNIATAMASHGPVINLSEIGSMLIARLSWNIGLLHYEENRMLALDHKLDESNKDHLLIHTWRKLSDTIGRQVNFGFNVMENPLYCAEVIDIAPDGSLLMKLSDGRLIRENSGEIDYL